MPAKQHPQLDLFGDSAAYTSQAAPVKARELVCETPISEPQLDDYWVDLSQPDLSSQDQPQFDLFLHSPLDQALNGLRLAILRGSIEFAQTFYQSAQTIAMEFDAKTTQDANSQGANLQGTPQLQTCSALEDANIAVQFIRNTSADLCARSQFRWLADNKPALIRFVGSGVIALINMRLKALAMSSELDEFDAAEPDAYAAQIWFDLNEPALANSVLARDISAKTCPIRLELWAHVCAALALTYDDVNQSDAAKSSALGHWLTLCFDWPEQAEMALATHPRFAARWGQFCSLDCSDDVRSFPGFSALYAIPWPAPDDADMRPGAELLRACQMLNSARDSIPLRLKLKAIAPEIFQDWLRTRVNR
jgi:hypothetical protein